MTPTCWWSCRYIEANPLRAKMVTDPGEYRWSSYPLSWPGTGRPALSPFPEWEELGRTEAERRKRWRAKVSATQKEAELTSVRSSLRSGRPFGDSGLDEQMAEAVGHRVDPPPQGPAPQDLVNRRTPSSRPQPPGRPDPVARSNRPRGSDILEGVVGW